MEDTNNKQQTNNPNTVTEHSDQDHGSAYEIQSEAICISDNQEGSIQASSDGESLNRTHTIEESNYFSDCVSDNRNVPEFITLSSFRSRVHKSIRDLTKIGILDDMWNRGNNCFYRMSSHDRASSLSSLDLSSVGSSDSSDDDVAAFDSSSVEDLTYRFSCMALGRPTAVKRARSPSPETSTSIEPQENNFKRKRF